jgi:hypothetical protein
MTRMQAREYPPPSELLQHHVLRRLAGVRSYERGEAYYAGGHVSSLAQRGGTIDAQVLGNRPYRVSLWVDAAASRTRAPAPWVKTEPSANTVWLLASPGWTVTGLPVRRRQPPQNSR